MINFKIKYKSSNFAIVYIKYVFDNNYFNQLYLLNCDKNQFYIFTKLMFIYKHFLLTKFPEKRLNSF